MPGSDPESAQERPGAWQVLTATERGAAHRASGLPNQDAVAAFPIGPLGAFGPDDAAGRCGAWGSGDAPLSARPLRSDPGSP